MQSSSCPRGESDPQKEQIAIDDPTRVRSWRPVATSWLDKRSGWKQGITLSQRLPICDAFSMSLLRSGSFSLSRMVACWRSHREAHSSR